LEREKDRERKERKENRDEKLLDFLEWRTR
jgi:hypothetical protein